MKLKYISWLPAFIIMVIIFYFSAKPATDSGESSLLISQMLLDTYENIINISYDGLEEYQVLFDLDHIVRKTAHFIEYACLAVALFFHFTIWKVGIKISVCLSILLTSSYAASDEVHQTFVAGRSGQVSDVLLDSCGAITGVGIVLLLLYIIKKLKDKKTKVLQ
jgi:VanZ family protein